MKDFEQIQMASKESSRSRIPLYPFPPITKEDSIWDFPEIRIAKSPGPSASPTKGRYQNGRTTFQSQHKPIRNDQNTPPPKPRSKAVSAPGNDEAQSVDYLGGSKKVELFYFFLNRSAGADVRNAAR